jgi:hypothetical protein
MTDIRLVGLAKPSDGTNKDKLQSLTGFQLRRDNDDWIVPGNDPVLLKGPSDVLYTNDEPWELDAQSYRRISQEYAQRFLLQFFEEKLTQPVEKVQIYGEWGIRTPLEERKLNFFLTPASAVPLRLEQDTFPFFVEQLNATAVAPIAVKADLQQTYISIPKILALIQYSGLDATAASIANQSQMNAALPTSLDVMSYLEAMNTMSPAAMTLPIHRMGSALHFMRGRPWFFPRLAIENIYEQLLSKIEPIVDSDIAFFTKDQHIQKRAIHAYFATSVESVNRLMRFLHDLRNYLDARGEFDPMKMVKAQSVVRLMFADWQSINFTNSKYIQIRLVFAFLDKLANLISIMKGGNTSEETLFKKLCSASVGTSTAKLIETNFGIRYHGLARLMAAAAQGAYGAIHSHIESQMSRGGQIEDRRLTYLRTLRNSAHGAFLRSNQFEDVFLAAGGTICSEFCYLPLILLWGFASNPVDFIQSI